MRCTFLQKFTGKFNFPRTVFIFVTVPLHKIFVPYCLSTALNYVCYSLDPWVRIHIYRSHWSGLCTNADFPTYHTSSGFLLYLYLLTRTIKQGKIRLSYTAVTRTHFTRFCNHLNFNQWNAFDLLNWPIGTPRSVIWCGLDWLTLQMWICYLLQFPLFRIIAAKMLWFSNDSWPSCFLWMKTASISQCLEKDINCLR